MAFVVPNNWTIKVPIPFFNGFVTVPNPWHPKFPYLSTPAHFSPLPFYNSSFPVVTVAGTSFIPIKPLPGTGGGGGGGGAVTVGYAT